MLTHIVRHIFGTTRPTNFKLSIRMEDDDSHQPQAPRSKVKVTRSRDQSEPSWPNAVPVLLEADGGIACRPNPVATLPIEINVYRIRSQLQRSNVICEQLFLLSYSTGRTDAMRDL